MHPLLIIYTGGTIGMRASADGYQPGEGIQALLKSSLAHSALQSLQPYKIVEFDNLIDSSNAQPKDWLQIAQCIADNYQQYSGFIVLHGTDTMAYTGAALHHILGDNIKPVIITGSQIPMSEPRSDGANNILDAALFARSQKVSQVCISFAGQLLAGHCAKKVHSSALKAFASPNHLPLANANISLDFIQQHTADSDAAKVEDFKLSPLSSQNVAVLYLYPGISDQIIEAAFNPKNTKAVVMLSYGAGNPPDQNQCLIKALKSAQQRNIPVINMSQCHAGSVSQGSYAVGSILNKLGVVSAGKRTLEDVVSDLYINSPARDL